MDLFTHAMQEKMQAEAPLAARMRPRSLDEYAGQTHIIGPGKLLRRAIEADRLFASIILWGPPGTGKTTLAMVIANQTQSHFETLSAVLDGKPRLREVVSEAIERRRLYSKRSILFIDEVHRWNKAQQDALLPYVENGTITLIGIPSGFRSQSCSKASSSLLGYFIDQKIPTVSIAMTAILCLTSGSILANSSRITPIV